MNTQNLLTVDRFLQVSGITSGRLESILAAVIGLISVVIGVRAVRSARRLGSDRLGATLATVTGLIGTILSGLHLVRSYSAGFGTGSGKAGAIVAMMFGLIGVILGPVAWARFIRTSKRTSTASTVSPKEKL
ncbi:MAG: DUF6223 family protein [Ginsengibacter sp.]